MLIPKKIETIPFKDFMSLPARIQRKMPLQTNIYSFLPPITLKALFPITDPAFAMFLTAGAVVVVIALSERLFASNQFVGVASSIAAFFRCVLPFVGYGLIFWFLFQL